MTVSQMLANMTQKELCHWIAFFRLQNARFEDRRQNGKNGQASRKQEVSQAQKDQLMMMQLLALAGKDPK